ncbi:BirA family transcriptional regulator, biotin operon repressor / biotin-[acetyl-CoA-carboxylase] ligase [Rhizobium sp. NFR07]|uniref:biotin--[acetyl-CoA-carboxylase] ligase n=1 Tax=Rhizobium sp. NFR07 TaxID=1566262 RepID=UPI0008EB3E63|nr:biotin--[acetyl-CoA-carboxylase] ligase [Rhizobium sp. NFR07]SFB60937.1 BirA family transcriptional regulator, biotin operon repressor / biotin-[acetyl-CoA-carboxylase] ligase [Rhizobium sp. NFR07]
MARNSGRFSLEAFRHVAFNDIGSTNSECLARARAGDSGLLWVTAARQTAGRGRRGRAWTSEPGNLYASLLLVDPAPIALTASLPLVVAIAVHEAIRAVLPPGDDALQVKWPNDILINRRKTCGILLEGEPVADGKRALAIGIGINIRHMPDSAPYGVTRLVDHGAAVSPDELFAHLFKSMAVTLESWDEGRGTVEIVSRWRKLACGIGERITVNLPDRSIEGIFAGIDDNGLLLLDRGDGQVMPIAAGDVFFARTE